MQQVTFVVPCFNEERRLDAAAVRALVAPAWARCLLVDDGSKDGTLALMERIAAESGGKVGVLALEKNQGKAEAVRRGLVEAAAQTPIVGFADADFATPPAELHRLALTLGEDTAEVVIGSRVALSGHQVRRKPVRHYLGRVFATVASGILRATVYDTQCGAKFFKVNDGLHAALSTPFSSRWLFDVELLGRLLVTGARVLEVPLHEWRDVAGSKLSARALSRVPLELLRIEAQLRRSRR